MAAKVGDFQRRHPAVARPIAVVCRYPDDGGSSLAALITRPLPGLRKQGHHGVVEVLDVQPTKPARQCS